MRRLQRSRKGRRRVGGTLCASVGVYGAGPELNRRLRAVPIPVTGGILGLRAGWTNQASLAELQTIRSLQDLNASFWCKRC